MSVMKTRGPGGGDPGGVKEDGPGECEEGGI